MGRLDEIKALAESDMVDPDDEDVCWLISEVENLHEELREQGELHQGTLSMLAYARDKVENQAAEIVTLKDKVEVLDRCVQRMED